MVICKLDFLSKKLPEMEAKKFYLFSKCLFAKAEPKTIV
jgi:hypothetical protein